ncbi:MAG TPA: FkbM family methyltransferase [Gammaproteobacteria bacterium]|nr:FkbM family methyltransferase [Gammaproteobacteria bacterium]
MIIARAQVMEPDQDLVNDISSQGPRNIPLTDRHASLVEVKLDGHVPSSGKWVCKGLAAMNPMSFLRRLASRRRDKKRRPEVTDFDAVVASLSPGDIAIDCGANVGKFTLPMARSGATVYAFEPNPDAYSKLVENTAAYPNVTTFQAAVTTAPGPVKLFLHKYASDDPLHFSTGSSLVGAKRNVRQDRFEIVDGIQFSDFIKSLGDIRVRLLKIDIEGAEVEVLNQLLDEGLHEVIDQAFVEVHDRQIVSLIEPTRRLRERLQLMHVTQFRLDWR